MPELRKDLLNPTLAKLLKVFSLDKEYISGQGNYLTDSSGERYLDFIAQFGAIPFGYNPEFVWKVLESVRKEKLPSLVQPSLPVKALELANLLARVSPGDLCYATFCQSGAEAVEAAIKLARSATGRKIIVSTQKSFHGKTLGALSATGRAVYQTPFGAPAPGFMHIPYNDINALQQLLEEQGADIAGFIVEPVQGEGGMIPANPGYLKAVQQLCNQYGVVFMVDEIQTGLGRTGKLFASEADEIEPDVMLLAKALGGGVLPLGVCLSSPWVYNDDFGSLHSSTFANNNVTCAVGCAVVEKLTENNQELIKQVKSKGDHLLKRAQQLKEKYPQVIKEARGRGLMVGIEFYEFNDCGSFEMAFLTAQGGFTALLAGYLLNVHHIRLAPFLNNPMTVRLEPPLTITYEEIDYVMDTLDTVARLLTFRDYAQLYRYLLGDRSKTDNITDFRPVSRSIKSAAVDRDNKPGEKFAFIIHYPAPEDVIANNPSFSTYTREELYQFLQWESQAAEPGVVCHMPAVRSVNGSIAEGWLIGIPFGARELMTLPREKTVEVIKKAVDMGRDLGAKIVGLGALTSVVTRGGRDVQGRGVAITSGNSFTTLMAMEGLFGGAEKMKLDLSGVKGAVLGATGSIGRACAIILAEKMSQIILLGNPNHPTSSKNRLNSLVQEILTQAVKRREAGILEGVSQWLDDIILGLKKQPSPRGNQLADILAQADLLTFQDIREACALLGIECRIKTSINIEDTLPQCSVIVAASNSPEYIIYPRHLQSGAVVCDVAKPADVAPETKMRDDVLVLEGGLVQYPDEISFGPNLGYRDGVSLACLSETVLLALEGDYKDYSIGSKLPLDIVEYFRRLGVKHGFGLAGLVMNNREISDREIEQIYQQSLAFN